MSRSLLHVSASPKKDPDVVSISSNRLIGTAAHSAQNAVDTILGDVSGFVSNGRVASASAAETSQQHWYCGG